MTGWLKFSSRFEENAEIAKIIGMGRAQAEKFLGAVNQSLDVAQAGYGIASDTETLLECLLDTQYSIEDLQSFIDSMVKKANKAATDCDMMCKKFSECVTGFYEVGYAITLPLKKRIRFPNRNQTDHQACPTSGAEDKNGDRRTQQECRSPTCKRGSRRSCVNWLWDR
jgi:hypothetical protein